MTEADLLYHFHLLREQLDETIMQIIGLTFALFIANYYFLHRSGLALKIGAFVLYFIGWYFFVISGMLTGQHLGGVVRQLSELVDSKEAGTATKAVLSMMRSDTNTLYVFAANITNFILLFGAAGFLFFWKHPEYQNQAVELKDDEFIERDEEE